MLNERGFTLVEIIAVLIILGILAGVAVPRFIDLGESTKLKVVNHGLTELNGRERMVFMNSMLEDGLYIGNADFDLGPAFTLIGTPRLNPRRGRVRYEYAGDRYVFRYTIPRRDMGTVPREWFLVE